MPHGLVVATTLLLFSVSGFAAGESAVSVRVHVVGPDGETVRNVYVALVPTWRPWSSPLVEEISETGYSIFHVARGTYYAVCGAHGLQVAVDGPYKFVSDTGGSVNVILKPLINVTGSVTDERGRPLQGVHVAEARGAIVAPFGRLSAMGVRHLSPDWSVISDEKGGWSLGISDGKVPLVFSAPGRATQWRFHNSNDMTPVNVLMPEGATLRVTCDRSDPNLVITLEQEGGESPDAIPHNWQRQLWAQWATTPALTWSSLPAGLYSIYAKYFDPKYFVRHAKQIGKVTVARGQSAELALTVPPLVRPASKAILIYLEGTPTRDVDVDDLQAFAVSADGEVRIRRCVVQEAVGGSVIHIDADDARLPAYAVTADHFIAANSGMTVTGESTPPTSAAVYPRADAHLMLHSGEKDLPFPRSGSVVLRNCSKTDAQIIVPLRIHGSSLADFTAPAGCQSGVLSFTPFEPFILARPLRPGDQSLGEVLLHAAAAADVHVIRRPGDAVVSGASVRVIALPRDSRDGERVLAAEGQTDPAGWVHIDGLPVRRDLEFFAQTPDGHSSLAALARAEPRERVTVDPLSVPMPATLIVTPTMKAWVYELFPSARIRAVYVEPTDRRRADEEKKQQNAHGGEALRFERLKPGKWRIVAIVDVAGTYAVLQADEVELKSGDTRKLEASVEPQVFHGRVTAGDKGVAARITLENRSADDVVRQHFDSSSDGAFHAVLANKGTYSAVAVRMDAQGDDIPLGEIEFNDPSKLVEIRLPSTGTLVARVRSGDRPVTNAKVFISRIRNGLDRVEQDQRGRLADAQGAARFENITAGDWTVVARTEEGGGAKKTVTVKEHEDSEVTLELEQGEAIEGSIHDAAGTAVPDVRVDCLLLDVKGLPERSNTMTDLEGKFTIHLVSKLAAPALCSVVAPAGIVDAFRAMPGDAAHISLPSDTGSLQITDWGQRYSAGAFWLAMSDGRVIDLSAVADVLGRFRTSLQIPRLKAGEWTIVKIQSLQDWIALAAGHETSVAAVTHLRLAQGKFESVRVYDTPAAGGTN